MKITYFAVRKELLKSGVKLQKLNPEDYYLVINFIKDVVKAQKKENYGNLFSAMIHRDELIEQGLDAVIPDFDKYCDMINETKEKMQITKGEEEEIWSYHGSAENRRKYDIDELDYHDFIFQNELRKRDKIYKRMKKKGYF